MSSADRSRLKVAILIFDDVEVLDFCGPFEVFSVAGRKGSEEKTPPFDVFTVAEKSPVLARNKLSVNPTYNSLTSCPTPDILVIPGGGGRHADGTPFGTRREMLNQELLGWIRDVAPSTQHILSVCTGALIVTKAGLLEQGMSVTTHHGAFLELEKAIAYDSESIGSGIDIRTDQRVVDNGKIVFSGGISAGIDAAFHLLAKLLGRKKAIETAAYMEYNWSDAQFS